MPNEISVLNQHEGTIRCFGVGKSIMINNNEPFIVSVGDDSFIKCTDLDIDWYADLMDRELNGRPPTPDPEYDSDGNEIEIPKELDEPAVKPFKIINKYSGRDGHPGHKDRINKVCVLQKEKTTLIITAGEDNSIKIFDFFDKHLLKVKELRGHTEFINCLTITDDSIEDEEGYFVISGSYLDRTVRMWDVSDDIKKTSKCVEVMKHNKSIFCLSQRKNNIAVGCGNSIWVWDTSIHARVKKIIQKPKEKKKGGIVRIPKKKKDEPKEEKKIEKVKPKPPGGPPKLPSGGSGSPSSSPVSSSPPSSPGPRNLNESEDNKENDNKVIGEELNLFDDIIQPVEPPAPIIVEEVVEPDKEPFMKLNKHVRPVTVVQYGEGGEDYDSLLFSGSDDCTICVWNIKSWELQSQVSVDTPIYALAVWNADPLPLFVTGSYGNDFRLRVWDLKKMNVISNLEGHTDKVLHTNVWMDGNKIRVSSTGKDCTIRTWDIVAMLRLYIFNND
jgi:WD40 repeat protein